MTVTEAPTRLEALMIENGKWNSRITYSDDAEIDVHEELGTGLIALAICKRDLDGGRPVPEITEEALACLTPEQAMKLAGRLTEYADEMSVADPAAVETLRQAVEDVPGWTIEGIHEGMSRSQVRCIAFKLGQQMADARKAMAGAPRG
jgi:hypothetical protein